MVWSRLAVEAEDFELHDLIRLPAKHGRDCAEGDAIAPTELRRRVQEAIEWHIDQERWEKLKRVAQRCGIPCDARALATGQQRRAFLIDPSHKHVFHFTPIHGWWLNQVELFFSVLSRRFLKRGDFASAAAFEERLDTWLESYNRDHAHPYRWTYAGEPLVRATPFGQTRRQQRRGRAWCGTHPPLWERRLYPPRPYKRKVQPLAANL